ncbi:hypothetical protein BGX27_001544, partial [Mortierella sp. AM989]
KLVGNNDHTYDFYDHTQLDIEQSADNGPFHGPNDIRKHVQIYKEFGCKQGLAYYNGAGVPQDYFMALAYFLSASDQGHAGAQFSLASMYYNGECINQDYSKSVELRCL